MGFLKHVSIVPFNKTAQVTSPNIKQEVVCKKTKLAAWSDRSIEINFHLTNYKVIWNGYKSMGLVRKG